MSTCCKLCCLHGLPISFSKSSKLSVDLIFSKKIAEILYHCMGTFWVSPTAHKRGYYKKITYNSLFNTFSILGNYLIYTFKSEYGFPLPSSMRYLSQVFQPFPFPHLTHMGLTYQIIRRVGQKSLKKPKLAVMEYACCRHCKIFLQCGQNLVGTAKYFCSTPKLCVSIFQEPEMTRFNLYMGLNGSLT